MAAAKVPRVPGSGIAASVTTDGAPLLSAGKVAGETPPSARMSRVSTLPAAPVVSSGIDPASKIEAEKTVPDVGNDIAGISAAPLSVTTNRMKPAECEIG